MMTRQGEEYRALRATIRERGTARIWVFAAGIALWAALALATSVLTTTPLAVLLPLLALAAVFEAVFALHTGAERIGHYLQVFHDDRWEQVAMELRGGSRVLPADTLFVIPFVTAVVLNLSPLLVANPVPVEWIFVGGAHGLMIVRLVTAHAAAVRQRTTEFERLEHLKGSDPGAVPAGQTPTSGGGSAHKS
jgi:cobalamin biosynthesis protein CobD/CbiB